MSYLHSCMYEGHLQVPKSIFRGLGLGAIWVRQQ